MTHRILVPLDQSVKSRKIFEQICKFLRPEENNLIVYQVIHPTLEEIEMPPAYAGIEWTPATYHYFEQKQGLSHEAYLEQKAAMKEKLVHALDEEAETLRAHGFNVEVVVEFGDTVEHIEDQIKRRQIDLVAMTTHGREGIDRIFHGSVSGKIVHDLNVPVLLLHPPSSRDAT